MSAGRGPSVDSSQRFSPEAIDRLMSEIEDAGGNEVFAAGRLDAEGKVAEILVAARGTKSAVPALAGFLERGDVIIHNHPSGSLQPSDADILIAAEAGSSGVGSYIVDNAVARVTVVAEPVRRKAYILLDEDEIGGVLEEGGKLSAMIPSYEPRKSQIKLTRDITRVMSEGGILAAEAGTGVGKSYAYLIPAFAWAIRNEERVVIATATINLQKQLIDKDIPVVQSLFRKKTKAVLVKGRGNYLCRTRLQEALDEEGIFAGEDHPLRKIQAWAEAGGSGDRSDLSFWPEESLWNRVCSESDSCSGLRCPRREECFVLRARREASDAQIIVANHHILFSDLATRMNGAGYEQTAVLPPFRALVFDEAHAIEASATSLFSEEFSRFSVNKKLSRILRRVRSRTFGIMPRLIALPSFPGHMLDGLPEAIRSCRAAMEHLDLQALGLFARERTWRLAERNPVTENLLLEPMRQLETSLGACAKLLGEALEACPEELAQEQAVHEARLSQRSLGQLAALCARFRNFADQGETVFWLEKGTTARGEAFAEYTATPLDITGTMNEAVFSKFRSIVCTSATLSVGGSFDFWKGRIGLARSDTEVETSVYPSPFPFRTNALLAVDSSAPTPDKPAFKSHVEGAILRLLEASGGRALVLFTSHEALKSAYEKAKPFLAGLGIACMRQGEDEKGRLLEAFRRDITSVLFATDSFWEGVDAPGETLSLVIICKLPFRVPTDPVQMARSEAAEKRGGNAFMEISLPEAVIRLKQGFGRLIRHSEDRGAVVILDSRIVTKRYGELFVSSLPPCRLVTESLDEVTKKVRQFLFDW